MRALLRVQNEHEHFGPRINEPVKIWPQEYYLSEAAEEDALGFSLGWLVLLYIPDSLQ